MPNASVKFLREEMLREISKYVLSWLFILGTVSMLLLTARSGLGRSIFQPGHGRSNSGVNRLIVGEIQVLLTFRVNS